MYSTRTFSFLAAFSFMCYTSSDNPTYFLMSIGWFTLMLLLAWCASASFETQAYFYPLPVRILVKLRKKYGAWRARSRDKSSKDSLGSVETGERQNQFNVPWFLGFFFERSLLYVIYYRFIQFSISWTAMVNLNFAVAFEEEHSHNLWRTWPSPTSSSHVCR